MKTVAILQSNYVPWKGYFDLIAAADEFVFYDDVQFTKNDWRNRNRIKTPQGAQWLSIPVHGSAHRLIKDIEVCDASCGKRHWKRLAANYSKARCFKDVARWLQPLYCDAEWRQLSVINRQLTTAICRFLQIDTRLSGSSDYALADDRNERLISLCRQLGAAVYLSGPRARTYLDTAAFGRAGLQVAWFDYGGYPDYPQQWGEPFIHDVSILDLLFNCGPDARRYMKASGS